MSRINLLTAFISLQTMCQNFYYPQIVHLFVLQFIYVCVHRGNTNLFKGGGVVKFSPQNF